MMQNNQNNSQDRFRRLLREKGYYIVLALCVAAVGISGYVFLTTAARQIRQTEQETLSVPTTVTEPEDEAVQQPPKQPQKQPTVREPEPPAQTPVTAAPEEASPVWPVSGEVFRSHAMDRLLYHPTTQDWRVHNGVDLAAAAGTPVTAALAGTVTAVYEDPWYGTTVIIRHDGELTTHYSSLAAETAVSAGDTVEAGQVIGHVGDTALLESADGPHLHFEVSEAGAPVDPGEFLP